MKKKLALLAAVLAFVALLGYGGATYARMSAAQPKARRIVIDAGHGGFDPGAVSEGDTAEQAINLAIAKMMEAQLVAKGYEVVLTREDDKALAGTKQEDMRKRRQIIADSGADYGISIHLNANPDHSCRGPVVLHHPDSKIGKSLALHLQEKLNLGLNIEKPRAVQTGNYYILKSGDMPIIIVECGFITNDEDEKLLKDVTYQATIATLLAQGLDEFIVEQAGQSTP